jgi:hypothetical protein
MRPHRDVPQERKICSDSEDCIPPTPATLHRLQEIIDAA